MCCHQHGKYLFGFTLCLYFDVLMRPPDLLVFLDVFYPFRPILNADILLIHAEKQDGKC